METRLFYVLEDENDTSSLYVNKEPWLESLKYNLDVAVEYGDLSQEESDEMYQKAENNAIGESLEANGFYYSVEEIKVIVKNETRILRDCDDGEVMVYEIDFEGKSYEFKKRCKIDELIHQIRKYIGV